MVGCMFQSALPDGWKRTSTSKFCIADNISTRWLTSGCALDFWMCIYIQHDFELYFLKGVYIPTPLASKQESPFWINRGVLN